MVRSIVEAGGRALAVQGDMGREEDVVRMFDLAEREFGAIRGLVNNAAITGGFARVERLDARAVERMLAVNVLGTMVCSREAVRRMSVRRGGGGGAIVNISLGRRGRVERGSGCITRRRRERLIVLRLGWRGRWRRRGFA